MGLFTAGGASILQSSKVLVTKQRFAIIRALLRRGLGNARMVL